MAQLGYIGAEPSDVLRNSHKPLIAGALMGCVGMFFAVVIKVSVLAAGAFFALSFGATSFICFGLQYLAAEELISWKACYLLAAGVSLILPIASAVALVAAGVFSASILVPTVGCALIFATPPLLLAFMDPSDIMPGINRILDYVQSCSR
jgi:hypothetical protein